MVSAWCKLWAACVVVGCVLVVVPVAGAGIGDAPALGSVGDVVAAGVSPVAEASGGAIDVVSAPVVEVVAPVVESVAAPVSEVVEPVVEVAQPVLEVVQPVVDAAAPIVDAVNSAVGTASGNVPAAGTSGGTSSPAVLPDGPVTPAPVAATPPVISVHPESDAPTAIGLIPGLTATLLSSERAARVAGDPAAATLVSGADTPWLATADPNGSTPAGLLPDVPAAPVALSPAGVAPGAVGFALLGLAALGCLLAAGPYLLGRVAFLLGAPARPAFIALLERPG
jgi:hypothetical protein